MHFSIQDGVLLQARQIESPNYDLRPEGTDIDLLVVHCISLPPGQYGGKAIEQFFTNCLKSSDHPYFCEIEGLKVSAHLLIRREGEVIQFVNFNHRAWHAGLSCFDGRECCNDFSIGIELEGTDETPFTSVQYQHLAEITAALREHYAALTPDNIVGHEDIAPGRKTDPGSGFDWPYFRSLIR